MSIKLAAVSGLAFVHISFKSPAAKADTLPSVPIPTKSPAEIAPLAVASNVPPPLAYAEISEAGICLVVVPSITINASESAMVIEEVDLAEPSKRFNSAAVEPTLVPPISKVVTDNSPATVTIFPLAVKVIKSSSPTGPIVPVVFITSPPSSIVNISVPSMSNTILPWSPVADAVALEK